MPRVGRSNRQRKIESHIPRDGCLGRGDLEAVLEDSWPVRESRPVPQELPVLDRVPGPRKILAELKHVAHVELVRTVRRPVGVVDVPGVACVVDAWVCVRARVSMCVSTQ